MTTEEMNRLRQTLLTFRTQGTDFGHLFTGEDILLDFVDLLQKQNDIMREALSFYCSEEAIVMLDGGSAYWTDKGIQDHGKRARKALKDCEGM